MATMTSFGYQRPRLGGPGVSDVLSGSRRYRRPSPVASGLASAPKSPRFQPAERPVPQLSSPGVTSAPGFNATSPAPRPGVYDLHTDPVLQQITALSGLGDEQAQAQALKQRQQLLTGYGDPGLSRAVLGDETQAQAAQQNPTSVLAGLGQQRQQNLHQLTENLNKQNLFYGGYRITQEQQAAQDYQAALAAAAAGVQGGLDTIASNLAASLGQNQQQRAQAAQDAYQRQLELALAAPPDYTGLTGDGGLNAAGYPPNTSYADIGATPSPITESMVAPPDTAGYPQPFGNVDLDAIAAQLFKAARGGQRMV